MRILINNIKMPIDHKIEDVLLAARDKARQSLVYAENFRVYRRSTDARRKSDVHFVYAVAADAPDGTDLSRAGNITPLSGESVEIRPVRKTKHRPVVVGTGPSGLFAAYMLALGGNPPLVIERGGPVERRTEAVARFWESGKLDPESNVQFGEGGAGTFSDGKLNTGNKDKRQRFVLETFAKFGAPEDILYNAKPHIGTDELKKVLINMRRGLMELGCEIRFDTKLTDIKLSDGRLSEIELDGGRAEKCDMLMLAIGHSSRDTYEMLLERGLRLEPKPFAAGVRIEHRQEFISRAQYGEVWRSLPPADYKLVYNGKERSCYSFCMCPGGAVVNASSEPGRLAVNGMSDHSRDGENANSALVVTVRPDDFGGSGPLAGIEFQRKYEALAFELGGSDFSAPVQLAREFAAGRFTGELGGVIPSFAGKTRPADLRRCLPGFITDTLREGLENFEHKIHGFASGDGVLIGIESRTSAPVRIARGPDFRAVGAQGVFPLGEGAGYAGGIMSAALDGIKAVLSLMV